MLQLDFWLKGGPASKVNAQWQWLRNHFAVMLGYAGLPSVWHYFDAGSCMDELRLLQLHFDDGHFRAVDYELGDASCFVL